MSYLVLARKYRPRTFADVKGQDHITRTLVNALKTDRVAHSYLFSGPRGVGKTTMARLLAMALSCEREDEHPPCGECGTCLEISAGEAVDVYEIDGASNRGIDEIRDLRETVRYLPTKGSFKVYIIDEVHMLTTPAFNALLKTLEEPPEHVVFIFATTEAHKVPATILSRCQRYDFKRIALKELVEGLGFIADSEGIRISPQSLRLIALESEGSFRDSLSLLDQVIAFSGLEVSDDNVSEALGLIDRALVADTAKALLAGDAGAGLDLLDRVYNYGHDTKDFTAQLVEYFRSLVVAKVSKTPETILDLLDAEVDEIKDLASQASLETLTFFFNALLENMDDLRRSAQPRLALEALIVRLSQIEAVQPLAELTARLEGLLRTAGPMTETNDRAYGPPQPPPEQKADPAQRPVREPLDEDEEDDSREKFYNDQFSRPAPKRLSDSGPLTWSGFLTSLKSKKPATFAFLQKGDVKLFNSESVELAFAKKNEADMIDPDELSGLLTEYLNNRPDLKIIVKANERTDSHQKDSEPAGANVSENGTVQTESGANGQTVNGSIVDHPLVKQAEKILKGRVVKVTP